MTMQVLKKGRIGCSSGPARAVPSIAEVLADHGPGLARMTVAYAREAADREDLLQEISVALWRALPSFRGESSVKTFVYRVARNRCVTYRARLRRRGERELRLAPEDSLAPLMGAEPRFPSRIEESQRSARLRAAVGQLPADLRRTLLLRLEGLSDQEIGERLGISANATAVRLFRARARLRNVLSPLHFGE